MVFWVFGYGSLIWNPGFEYDEKVLGFIKDYRRCFDVACIDHRGTLENPARTCSLEHNEGAICWGVAYCVRGGPHKERVAMEYLERRECEYDRKASVDFYKEGDTAQPAVKGVIVQIATAFGPCGNNRDYIFMLEKAMYDIGHEDDFVIELANEVRKVLGIFVVIPTGKKKKTTVRPSSHSPRKSQIQPLPVHKFPEAVTMDS